MYKKTGRNSGVYELQPLEIEKESKPVSTTPYKTHIRRLSFVPKDIQLVMIDDSPLSPNHEIPLIDPKADSPYVALEQHTLISVEVKPSESSLMSPSVISSNINDNNNLIKNRRRNQKRGCCRRILAPCCCLILLLLAACGFVYYLTSQKASENSAGFFEDGNLTEKSDKLVAEFDSTNTDTFVLPKTVDYGIYTRNNRNFTLTPTKITEKIAPSTESVKNARRSNFQPNFGSMKQISNQPETDVVISPLAIDETVFLIGDHFKHLRQHYYGKMSLLDAKIFIFDCMNAVNNNGFNDVHVFFTKKNHVLNDSKNPQIVKDYPIGFYDAADLDYIPKVIRTMNEEFGKKSGFYQQFDLEPFMFEMTPNELLPVSLFYFSMRLEEVFPFISKHDLAFYTSEKTIMMKKLCGDVRATVNYLSKNGKNSTLITLPLQDNRFRFFVYVGNNTNSNYSLPTLDLEFLTESLKNVGNLTVENIVLPKINKNYITNSSAVISEFKFSNSCIKFPKSSASCIYLEKIVHATHFKLDHDGINVAKETTPQEAQVTGQIIHIDRPFYYGVWFNNGIHESYIYFGSYFGQS